MIWVQILSIVCVIVGVILFFKTDSAKPAIQRLFPIPGGFIVFGVLLMITMLFSGSTENKYEFSENLYFNALGDQIGEKIKSNCQPGVVVLLNGSVQMCDQLIKTLGENWSVKTLSTAHFIDEQSDESFENRFNDLYKKNIKGEVKVIVSPMLYNLSELCFMEEDPRPAVYLYEVNSEEVFDYLSEKLINGAIRYKKKVSRELAPKDLKSAFDLRYEWIK